MYEFAKRKKKDCLSLFFSIFLSSFFLQCFAQFTEDFSDGDFSTNPTWSGDTSGWIDTLGMLRSNVSVSNAYFYLSTPSTIATNAQWEWWDSLEFNTSSLNNVYVFLTSDTANLDAGSFNGYYIHIGNTSDEISLYKRTGGTVTELIDGLDGLLNNSKNVMRIKITRDSTNLWTLFRDSTGTGNYYVIEGTATDSTFTSCNYFGIAVEQSTSSFFKKHWFDNFYAGSITGDTSAPSLSLLTVISSTQLDLKFSEPISQPTAENEINYSVNNSIGNPSTSVRDTADSSIVHLVFSTAFGNGITNTITISNLQDSGGNIMTSLNQNFTYFVAAQAIFKDVVISEIFADPSPQIGLPNAEFVELHNKSNKTFDLAGWRISDGSSTATLGSFVLYPDSFLILCPTANIAEYAVFGATLGLASFPSLNNTGDNLTFSDSNATIIDAVSYSDTWYQDAIKDDGGWSLELINPNNPCSGANNWIASADSSGGTPGKINSVNDTIPDSQAPSLVSVNIVSPGQIELSFSEIMDSTSISNGTYIIDNGLSVVSVTIAAGNFSLVTLTLTPQIDTAIVYTLSVSNVSDCSGNLIGANDSLQFLIGAIPMAKDVIINEFMAILTPDPVSLPDREYIEFYNNSSKIFNLTGWKYMYNTTAKILPSFILLPDSYLILCSVADTSLFSLYGNVLGISSWPALVDGGASLSILDNSDNIIDDLTYSSSWPGFTGGKSMELINPGNPCSGANNWSASNDSSGGTPGKINSVYSTAPDTVQPSLVSVTVVSANTIELTFNEPIDSASLVNGTYTIDNGNQVYATFVSPGNYTVVSLTLGFDIDTGIVYTVSASGVFDCSGNLIGANDSLQFLVGYIPSTGDIIINEIYADTNPQVGLPNAEFVELFNKTNKVLSLGNCDFSGATFPPDAFIQANGYAILCYAPSTPLLSSYGNTIAMNGWSGSFLTNAGKELIFTLGNIQIDRVLYSDSWYKSAVKDDGGWSLELINPTNPCNGAGNWIASVDSSGGTPGKINSVFSNEPDTVKPGVLSVTVITQNQIQIDFSEEMDSASLHTNYTISNGINVTSVQPVEPDFTSVLLNVSPALDPALVYTGNIFSVSDCPGNMINNEPFTFVIGVAPTFFDVLINEIYPDPDASVTSLPEVEFVELYNKTSLPINLSGCKFSDGNDTATITAAVILPYNYLIICSSAYSNEYNSYGKTTGLSGFPNLNNAGDDLIFLNSSGNLIHEVNYTDDWYGDEVKKDGGWTLELIDPGNPCGEGNNWKASNDAAGGTPGKINSVNGTNPDILPPKILSAYSVNPLSVILNFDESVDSLSAKNANYSINNGINVFAILVIDRKTVQVNLANALQPKILYTVTASGMYDCVGNTTTNTSSDFALAEQGESGDIIINEVLFDPRTGGSDFVEVYNNSGKIINLQDWELANIDNDSISNRKIVSYVPLVMFPKDYLVFTKDTANIRKEYPLGKPENYRQMATLPSYNVDSGTVVLINNLNNVSDAFSYNKELHFALLKDDKGVSLERIDFNRPTSDATNWHSAAEAVGWATPGYQNSQYNPPDGDGSAVFVEPEIFSPDNDGVNDIVNINYKFDTPGFTATIVIYDAKGRQIRNLAKGALLGIEGVFSWDGISDSREKARIGIYLIWFEAFDLSGKVLHFKKTCVLAGKID